MEHFEEDENILQSDRWLLLIKLSTWYILISKSCYLHVFWLFYHRHHHHHKKYQHQISSKGQKYHIKMNLSSHPWLTDTHMKWKKISAIWRFERKKLTKKSFLGSPHVICLACPPNTWMGKKSQESGVRCPNCFNAFYFATIY